MPQSQSSQEFGFIIGPLKKSKPDKLANRIFRLLNCLGIQCKDITKVSVNTQNAFAKVNLRLAAAEDYAIKAFKEKRAVMDLFDLRLITEKPQNLRVDRILPKKPSSTTRAEAETKRSISQTAPSNMRSTTGSSMLHGSNRGKRVNVVSVASLEKNVKYGNPKEKEKKLDHIHDIISLSESSSTTSDVGFEELEEEEEENLEDYSEKSVARKKSKPKSRSMQTSEESSSSGGAECSSQEEQAGASANASRTSGDSSDQSSMDCTEQEEESRTKAREAESGSLHRSNPGLSSTLDHTKAGSPMHKRSSLSELDQRKGKKASSKQNIESPYETIAIQDGRILQDAASKGGRSSKQNLAGSDHGVNVQDIIQGYEALDISDNAPLDEDFRAEMVNARTSTDPVGPCFCSGTNFYHRGEQIRVPAMNVYFDAGCVALSDLSSFRGLIGRNVCAFLNSGGGLLYFGVDPSTRRVIGIEIGHKHEDTLRLAIDEHVKLITPLVPTSAYKVNFAKVMLETGHLMANVRVLEMEVTSPGQNTRVLCSAQGPDDKRSQANQSGTSRYTPRHAGYSFKKVRYIWENNCARTYF